MKRLATIEETLDTKLKNDPKSYNVNKLRNKLDTVIEVKRGQNR